MTAEQITAVINLGAAGAVIIVVVYFLKFIKERDKDWQEFFKALLANKETPMQELAEAVHALLSEFRDHDTWEHTKLDEMTKTISTERKTQPRKRDAGGA